MMKRHAYLIIAHHNFGQLRKLLELLDDPRNDIFVHVDRKSKFDAAEWKNVCRHSSLRFLDNRIAVRWGGVSIIRCELALLREAVQSGDYSYYHLLSGVDLPIKTQDEIHDFFEKHNGTEFLNYWKREDPALEKRYNYRSVFPDGERNVFTRRINHIGIRLQRLFGCRINGDIDFRYGSQWFSITGELARYVISQEDWIERVFAHTVICDEIFMATLVWNSHFRERLYISDEIDSHQINESNMRFIDWSRGKSIRHPWTFVSDDWEQLMSVPHLWARKFDENTDAEIIDKIYNHLKNSR